jgi:hypothetical protein
MGVRCVWPGTKVPSRRFSDGLVAAAGAAFQRTGVAARPRAVGDEQSLQINCLAFAAAAPAAVEAVNRI